MAWALGISTFVVLLLGVLPQGIIDWARQGAEAIIQAAASIFTLI
jgi:hypothetical protein